jgi:hypothetical protein
MSEDGSNIFFFTTTSLVSQDTDELQDLYDARVGGGTEAAAAVSVCSGEECQGAYESPSPFGPFGSTSLPGGENFTAK